jgi:uncharacterized protein YukE
MTALAGTIISGVLALTGMWTAAWLIAVAALLTSTVVAGTAPAPRTFTAGHAGAVSADPGAAPAPVEPHPAAAVPDELADGSLGVHLSDGVDRITQLTTQLDAFTTAMGGASRGLNTVRSTTFQVLGQISELGDMSDRISGMVDAIRRIASQTNLLSLNATIEAARAGEAGRGFAVVAGEVRKLAQDSRDATESIDAIVTEVRETTEITVEVANGASEQVEATKTQFERLEQAIAACAAELREVSNHVSAAQDVVSRLPSTSGRAGRHHLTERTSA